MRASALRPQRLLQWLESMAANTCGLLYTFHWRVDKQAGPTGTLLLPDARSSCRHASPGDDAEHFARHPAAVCTRLPLSAGMPNLTRQAVTGACTRASRQRCGCWECGAGAVGLQLGRVAPGMLGRLRVSRRLSCCTGALASRGASGAIPAGWCTCSPRSLPTACLKLCWLLGPRCVTQLKAIRRSGQPETTQGEQRRRPLCLVRRMAARPECLLPGNSPLPGPCPPAQRFISRKTVDKVLKELREATGGGSRPGSRASGSFGSSSSAGPSGPSSSGPPSSSVRPSDSVTAERR